MIVKETQSREIHKDQSKVGNIKNTKPTQKMQRPNGGADLDHTADIQIHACKAPQHVLQQMLNLGLVLPGDLVKTCEKTAVAAMALILISF